MAAKSCYLLDALKLLRQISCKENIHKNSLDTLITEFRSRNDVFLGFPKPKLYVCPKCNNPWKEGKFSMRIRSVKVPRKLKKWVHTSSDDISCYKKKLAKSFRSKQDNTMVVRCLICHYITKCHVTKPKIEISTEKEESNDTNVRTKKKKKKKKDVFAGLKIEQLSRKVKSKMLELEGKDNKLEGSEGSSVIFKFKDGTDKNAGKGTGLNKDCTDENLISNISSNISDKDVLKSELKTQHSDSPIERVSCLTPLSFPFSGNESSNSVNVIEEVIPRFNKKSTTDNCFKKDSSSKIRKCDKRDLHFLKNKKKKHMVSVPKSTKNINKYKSELKDFLNCL